MPFLKRQLPKSPGVSEEKNNPASPLCAQPCYLGEPRDCSFEEDSRKYTTLLAKFRSHFHRRSYPLCFLFIWVYTVAFIQSHLNTSVHIESNQGKDSDASLLMGDLPDTQGVKKPKFTLLVMRDSRILCQSLHYISVILYFSKPQYGHQIRELFPKPHQGAMLVLLTPFHRYKNCSSVKANNLPPDQ